MATLLRLLCPAFAAPTARWALSLGGAVVAAGCAAPPGPAHPLLFVTQVPANRNGDQTRGGGPGAVTNTFGNQVADVAYAPRGGDLMLLHPDGSLRNLTREAGFGEPDEAQGARAVAVRQPCVHWGGERALVSMVVGAPEGPGEPEDHHWQIYEVSGLGEGETARLRRLDGQPEDEDNVSPAYAPDDRVLYTSTQPLPGSWPQLDEYESSPTVTGIWALREGEAPALLEHAPSGAFGLFVDSFGRLLFTKWDHLSRDQQADNPTAAARFRPRTFEGEAPGAAYADGLAGLEDFPEPRNPADPSWDGNTAFVHQNHFFPWQLAPDGTGEETLNHLGRHELGGSPLLPSFLDDPALGREEGVEPENPWRMVPRSGLFHLREDPLSPGTLYATYAYEFFAAGGGALVRLDAPPDAPPTGIVLEPLTALDAFDPRLREGSFRGPLPLSDGGLVASYTAADQPLLDEGGEDGPSFPYTYRLWLLRGAGGSLVPDRPLTGGIERTVSWWEGEEGRRWSGVLWELDAVELSARPRPEPEPTGLEAPEAAVFAAAGVEPAELRAWMVERGLALLVVRDLTRRDAADHQQPYHLAVPGGVSAGPPATRPYEVSALEVLQADLLRGYRGSDAQPPIPGRRALPAPVHGEGVGDGFGGVAAWTVAPDGSVAGFVPAGRALTWQLLGRDGAPVVRERVWVSAAPGEIRTCPACHGVNERDQLGDPPPENEPAALRALLERWLDEA